MNKVKVLIGLLLVFLSFNFTACEDEPVDPALLIPVPEESSCAAPSGLSVSNFVGTSVTVAWTAVEGTAWEVQYGLHGFLAGAGTSVAANTTNVTVNGLNTANDYDFYVRTNCGDGTFSDWIGPVAVGTSITLCATPTNFSALRSVVTNTQVNLVWNANGDENGWQVQYGATGFALGSGTIVTSSTTSKAITGLLAAEGYDFYLRSNCSATNNSVWVGPVHVAPVVVAPNSFFAKVDGIEFVDTDLSIASTVLNATASTLITAGDATNNEIKINVHNDTTVGTVYTTTNSATDKFKITYSKPLPTAWTTAPNATLTITQRTGTRLKGTFQFTATDATGGTDLITEGIFDVILP